MVLDEQLKPSAADVALLCRTRTTQIGNQVGLGSDSGPVDGPEFTESTRPTREEAEAVITQAWYYICPQLDAELPASSKGLAQHTIALYAAVLIETSFFRETVNQALLDMWRDAIATNILKLNEVVEATQAGKRFGTLTIGTTVAQAAAQWPDALTAGTDEP
jgi:hypothetical protein